MEMRCAACGANQDHNLIRCEQCGKPLVFAASELKAAHEVADNRKAGVAEQTRDVLAKIDALLAEAGTDKSKLVAVNVFLPQIGDFDTMNEVYDAWIDPASPPARACVEARLADPNLRVEITAIAAV